MSSARAARTRNTNLVIPFHPRMPKGFRACDLKSAGLGAPANEFAPPVVGQDQKGLFQRYPPIADACRAIRATTASRGHPAENHRGTELPQSFQVRPGPRTVP